MKKRLLVFLFLPLAVAGALWVWRARSADAPRVLRLPDAPLPVLMYHNVADDPGSDRWTVATGEFRRQIAELKASGYQTILPGDLFSTRPLPPKPILLTFDDGCLGILENAEPVLREAGFRAVSFLITDKIARDAKSRKMYRAYPALVWKEIRAMRRRGTFVFGSHSRTHAKSRSHQIPEAAQTRERFRARTGGDLLDYAYPHGRYTDAVVEAVREAGFRCAFICGDRVWDPRAEPDAYLIPRVSIFGGRHEFRVEREPGAEGGGAGISARASNAGVALPVLAILRDAGYGAAYPLVPERALDGRPQVWTWADAPSSGGDFRVEIWEQNRLFRYAEFAL
jgi:peptidoglycan/xylan/chitin deacetylase (PgdA/CDA1 family)